MCREQGKSVIPEGVCVLLALATPKKRALEVMGTVQHTCQAHNWVKVVINHFETPPAHLPPNPACVIQSMELPGFKSRFWKRLSPEIVRGFTHIFLPDSDMAFGPSDFDMVAFLRISAATNVSVLAPSPYGSGNGMFPLGDHAHGGLRQMCGGRGSRMKAFDPVRRCAACLHATVEVKAPLFTSHAWKVLHARIYTQAPDDVLLGDGYVDHLWCNFLGEVVHGCKLPWMLKQRDPGFGRKPPPCMGQACAYSYATPLRHLNDNVINTCGELRPVNFDDHPLHAWLVGQRFGPYWTTPSLRPGNTSLTPERACWDLPALATKVAALEGFNITSVAVLAQQERVAIKTRETKAARSHLCGLNNQSTAKRILIQPKTIEPKVSRLRLFHPNNSTRQMRRSHHRNDSTYRTQEECSRSFSAAHAGRASAWCGGDAGGYSRAGFGDATGTVCMLTPVYQAHFHFLAKRVEATYRLALGELPTTVAVFDDGLAVRSFCQKHHAACRYSHLYLLNLAELLGPSGWRAAQDMLRTGGYAKRAKLRDSKWPGDQLAQNCAPKFGPQCYQSLKKFYGAAEGPSHCQHFWVSDAETYPFRPYNFTALVAHSFTKRHMQRDAQLFKSLLSWYPDRWGCNHTQNKYGDASCGEWVASTLSMGQGYPAMLLDGTGLWRKMRQSVFDLNNWWMYERSTVRAMIDRTEQLRGVHFASYFASLQMSDVQFWTYSLEFLAARPGSQMASNSFFDLLQGAFPDAFGACCLAACAGAAIPAAPHDISVASPRIKRRHEAVTNISPMCHELSDMWSPCFRAHASDAKIAAFLVEQLGMFSIFGDAVSTMPHSLLNADHRISWVHCNANRWSGIPSFGRPPAWVVIGHGRT